MKMMTMMTATLALLQEKVPPLTVSMKNLGLVLWMILSLVQENHVLFYETHEVFEAYFVKTDEVASVHNKPLTYYQRKFEITNVLEGFISGRITMMMSMLMEPM